VALEWERRGTSFRKNHRSSLSLRLYERACVTFTEINGEHEILDNEPPAVEGPIAQCYRREGAEESAIETPYR